MNHNLDLKITGNPFIDVGTYSLKIRANKEINELTVDDVKIAINELSELYTTLRWKKDLYSIFPNSILVNPSTTHNPDLKKTYINYLSNMIKTDVLAQGNGSCMGCGRRNISEEYGKETIPLTGSKSLINYFPFGKFGADYCPLCALLIQFSPLQLYKCGRKFILLHSNSDKVMSIWAEITNDNINRQIITKNYTGCYYNNIPPVNAIFDIIFKVINSAQWKKENFSINFYEFSNFNQNPQLKIHIFPPKLFNFLSELSITEQNRWTMISEEEYNTLMNKNEFK